MSLDFCTPSQITDSMLTAFLKLVKTHLKVLVQLMPVSQKTHPKSIFCARGGYANDPPISQALERSIACPQPTECTFLVLAKVLKGRAQQLNVRVVGQQLLDEWQHLILKCLEHARVDGSKGHLAREGLATISPARR